MKKNLLLAVIAIIVLIAGWRYAVGKWSIERFDVALYFAHVQAIDSDDATPVEFDLRWDHEDVSPFLKGSGPTVVERLSDGTKILSLVGVYLEDPVRVEVTADGYEPSYIEVKGSSSGILTQDSSGLIRVVKLKKEK